MTTQKNDNRRQPGRQRDNPGRSLKLPPKAKPPGVTRRVSKTSSLVCIGVVRTRRPFSFQTLPGVFPLTSRRRTAFPCNSQIIQHLRHTLSTHNPQTAKNPAVAVSHRLQGLWFTREGLAAEPRPTLIHDRARLPALIHNGCPVSLASHASLQRRGESNPSDHDPSDRTGVPPVPGRASLADPGTRRTCKLTPEARQESPAFDRASWIPLPDAAKRREEESANSTA